MRVSRTHGGDTDLSTIARLLADPARAQMLQRLLGGEALPAGVLAAEAGVAPSTASGHLNILRDGGLVAVESHGRHRYYSLAGRDIAQALEQLALIAPNQPVRSFSGDTRMRKLSRARTCYDHLAGELGVSLLKCLVDDGLVTGHDGTFQPDLERSSARSPVASYQLSEKGHRVFVSLGIPVDVPSRRPLIRHCVDWTERRHHLAGRLGAELCTWMFDQGWIERGPVPRSIVVTGAGAKELKSKFRLELE